MLSDLQWNIKVSMETFSVKVIGMPLGFLVCQGAQIASGAKV